MVQANDVINAFACGLVYDLCLLFDVHSDYEPRIVPEDLLSVAATAIKYWFFVEGW